MIYWCQKCGEPIFDKELHACKCDGKIKQISSSTTCNPVFLQERKMLSYIAGDDLTSAKMWDLGSGHYIVNGEKRDIRYKAWYDAKEHLKYADRLRSNIEIEEDYSPYYGAVEANLEYLKKLILEAEMYTISVYKKFSPKGFYPTISFSGGKDSTVVSKIVRDALQTASIPHFFGDTTIEFAETYEYTETFRKENPFVPMLPSETDNDFFYFCNHVMCPPSQHDRWCCNIFKTSNLNKELEYLPKNGKSLSFLGIRHSESVARSTYERTQEESKISTQINAMPIIEWKDYDVWLYIIYKNIRFNNCYQYGYKRVGCWCCPNNSDLSMMLTEIYHPDYIAKWKKTIMDFAKRDGRTDPEAYYEEGKWKVRRGIKDSQQMNVTIADTACNLSDKARNIIVEKKIGKDIIELFKPLGKLDIIEKKDATYISVFDRDKSNEFRKCCELIITVGTNVIKVLPEDRIDTNMLINRIKCQVRKYQMCVRCHSCDSVCPYGAIDTTQGYYHIDERKCAHCKACIAHYYNGCIISERNSGKKGA